ncbi:MAG: hypothetical protein ACYDCK_03155 [Thermoplasmatota archaeon]
MRVQVLASLILVAALTLPSASALLPRAPVQQEKQCTAFAPFHPTCSFTILITDHSDVNVTLLFPSAFTGDLIVNVSQSGIGLFNSTCDVIEGAFDLAASFCFPNGTMRYTNGVPLDFRIDASSLFELGVAPPVGGFGLEARWDY